MFNTSFCESQLKYISIVQKHLQSVIPIKKKETNNFHNYGDKRQPKMYL